MSSLDPSHVVLPASLYHKMALCYYGSGPRASGLTPEDESPPATEEEGAVAPDPQLGFNGDPPPPRHFTALVPQGRERKPSTGGVSGA